MALTEVKMSHTVHRGVSIALCLRTELVRFGQEIFLAVMDLWVSYTSLLWPSISSSMKYDIEADDIIIFQVCV